SGPMKNLALLMVVCSLALRGEIPISQVRGGGEFSLFLKADGSLWGMGWNMYHQVSPNGDNISLPTEIFSNGVAHVAAGGAHTLFIKGDGSLWATGENQFGELGDGSTSNTTLPKIIVPSDVVGAAAGVYFSLFVKRDGSLWGMGLNSYGQLGAAAGCSCATPM